MKPIKRLLFSIIILALMAVPFYLAPTPAAADPDYTCLPTCETTDGRFLTVAGDGLSTLADQSIHAHIAVSEETTTFELGIFDGDTGGIWDFGTANLQYLLFADRLRIGDEITLVGTWMGDDMLNNDWFTINVTNIPEAQAPSGSYFYHLVVRNPTPTPGVWSNFKLRTDGVASIIAQAFSFAAPIFSDAEIQVIYPNYPDLSVTTYDGGFDFQIYVMNSVDHFAVFDGDLDRGSFDLTSQDTDDPDTPNDVLPPWAGSGTAMEGVAVGLPGTTSNPNDDSAYPLLRRSPAVVYNIAPLNVPTYFNSDPSGNIEWEQFRIETDPTVPADVYVDEQLTSGLYHIHLRGMDLTNLNAWRFQYPVVGVCPADPETGEVNPCEDLPHPYLIGDTVWFDDNLNGAQEDGEAGVPGVVVCLFDGDGAPILDVNNNQICTTTDADGKYFFDVEGRTVDPLTGDVIEEGVYTVRVEDENFEPGAPLEGYTSTTGGEEQTYTVIDENVLTYDFGYAIPPNSGSIGDLVWKDRNMNGVYDPRETLLRNVAITLSGDTDNDGHPDITATTRTDINGHYLFEDLPAGNYTVRVVGPSFLLSLVQTYDYDGVDTPNVASLTLGIGESNLDVDFGYWIRLPPKPKPPVTGEINIRTRR